MDRVERLRLEIDDQWTPVIEKFNSHLEYLKKRLSDASTSLGYFSIALSFTNTTAGKLLNSLWKFPFTKLGMGFTIAGAAVSGFGKGMKQVGSLVVKELQLMISVAQKFAPLIKGVFGSANAITSGVTDAAKVVLKLPFVEKFKAWGMELLDFQKGLENLRNRMTTVFKSFGAGSEALDRFTKAASQMPFQIEQVTESVATIGSFDIGTDNLKDMSRYIQSVGNTAAATGRDIADLSYAFANATTGMMRGLKTVGITSAQIRRELGEEIDYATEIGRKKIADAVSKIMDKRFAGAMQRYMTWTMGGLQSNLEDFINTTKRKIGGDLGLVVVNFMQKLTKIVDAFRNNMERWDKVTKNVGYSFAIIGRVVGDVIVKNVAILVNTIQRLSSDNRWKDLWNAIARILGVVVDVLLDDLEEGISRITASLYRAIPLINKIPDIVEKAWAWFDAIEELIYSGLVKNSREWIKSLALDKLLPAFASVNKWILQIAAAWKTGIGFFKIGVGLLLMFGGFFTGPIGAMIASFFGMLLAGWGGVDLGMAAAFATASKGFAVLQKGIRNFLVWADGVVEVIVGLYNIAASVVKRAVALFQGLWAGFDFLFNVVPTKLGESLAEFLGIAKKGSEELTKNMGSDSAGPLTAMFDKVTSGMENTVGKITDMVSEFTANIAKARDEAFSKEDKAKDMYKSLRELTEKAYSDSVKETALLESRNGLLSKQNELRKDLATSVSEVLYYEKAGVSAINNQIAALSKEKQAYLAMSLAYAEKEGLTNENKIKMNEYESKLAELQKARLEAGRKERDQALDVMSQFSDIYAERASRYSDDMRFQGARINAMKTELSFETAKMSILQNTLKYEKLGLLDRLKYLGLLEQQKSKVKQLKDEMRGATEDDWITQAFGAVRGIENLAPTKGSASYMAISSPTPSYAAITVTVEDRRDLGRAINDKILPAIEKKIYDDSSTNYRPMSGY
jgi:hypothetical protein